MAPLKPGTLRVGPTTASGLPGDALRDLAPDPSVRLEPTGGGRAVLDGSPRADRGGERRTVLFGADRAAAVPGGAADRFSPRTVEVVVDGWRFELVLEDAARAALRERARRDRADAAAGGPIQIRAIIPGRVLSISVAIGDRVTADQQVLVLEAMKMQNEVRAPADGVVEGLGVGLGQTVELGDVLLTIAPAGDAR